MTDATTDTTTGAGESGTGAGGEQKTEGQTFTQADVDKIVRDRLAQQAKNKFGDYDDLKTRADGAKSVEQKLVDLEAKHAAAEARALRSDIAAKHGITAEDRDLFLTGADEETLTAQASRLAVRVSESKKQGNVAPKEGDSKTTGKAEDVVTREFVSELFGGAAD